MSRSCRVGLCWTCRRWLIKSVEYCVEVLKADYFKVRSAHVYYYEDAHRYGDMGCCKKLMSPTIAASSGYRASFFPQTLCFLSPD